MLDHKTFKADLAAIMDGKTVLPNFEELPLDRGIGTIAAGGGLCSEPGVRNAKVPGSTSSWGAWARYFLSTTQGGQLDGTGYVIWWDQSKGRVGHFAICKHENVAPGTVEQSRRGYHPGRCGLCGLDLTVDSSD